MASGVIMEAPPAGRRGSKAFDPLEVLEDLPPDFVAEPVIELLSVSEPFEVPELFAVPDVLDSLLLSLLLSPVGVALALEVLSVLLAELSLLLLLLFVDDAAWLEESS